MTREEAITVFKAFMNNSLFSDVHKAAFNIAIHDIKQRHDWAINNLVLINKDNYEPLEQEPILDKIRAEINKLPDLNPDYEMDKTIHVSKWAVFDIIDKYKAESEEKNER